MSAALAGDRHRAYHARMTDLAILLLVILAFALLFRGPKTLPKLGAMFGRGVRQARREAAEITGPKSTEGPQPRA